MAMRYSAGYRIERFPRYELEHDASQIGENLEAQRTLWAAIRFLLVGNSRATVELRLQSGGRGDELEVRLLVAHPELEVPAERLRLMERLLPREYRWTALDSDRLREPRAEGPWRVARLVRRVDFFTLPASWPWMFADATGSSPEEGPALAAPMVTRRQLPLRGIPIRRQLEGRSLCVPLLGEMLDCLPDRWRLCEELLGAGPSVVSLAIHPIDRTALLRDRPVATHLQRAVEPFERALSSAGYAAPAKVGRAYDRYWLPEGHLCLLTLRAAALEDSTALAIAHHLASRLGGSQAFEVHPPRRDDLSLVDLANPQEYLPSPGGLSAHRCAWVRFLDDWLGEHGIDRRDRYADEFLLRFPHLYTFPEAEQILRLPFGLEEGLPGLESGPVAPFYSSTRGSRPADLPVGADRIAVGYHEPGAVRSDPVPDPRGRWHTVTLRDLTKHAFVTGSPGSGKTVTTLFLLRQLAGRGIPFMVIEPVKAEYYEALKDDVPDLIRWRIEGELDGTPVPDYLAFDPMRLQYNVSVARHVSYLVACFESAFAVTDALRLTLEKGIRAYYLERCGLSLFQRGGPGVHKIVEGGVFAPSFEHFCGYFLEEFLPKELVSRCGGESEMRALSELFFTWKSFFRRRLEGLRDGPLGVCFRRAAEHARREGEAALDLLRPCFLRPVVVELDGLTDNEQKALVMAFLLMWLYEWRQSDEYVRARMREEIDHLENLPRSEASDRRLERLRGFDLASPRDLAHVLVIEEAHRLLSSEARRSAGLGDEHAVKSNRGLDMLVDMLAESRAYGQGLMIVEQIPTKLVPEVIKNTNLKIMLRLSAAEDREYLGDAMGLTEDQARFIASLRPLQSVVFEDQLDRPVLLHSPPPRNLPGDSR